MMDGTASPVLIAALQRPAAQAWSRGAEMLGDRDESVAIVQWNAQDRLSDGRAALLRNLDGGWQAGVAAMAEAGLASVPPGIELYTNRFVAKVLPG